MATIKTAVLIATLSVAGFSQEIPRPEYPQPQLQRELWQTLNGKWEFEFDDANAGLDAGWASGGKQFSKSILVPYCFESKLSGIGDTSFHPWVWYRRTFTVPSSWKGQRVLLHFGAADYRAIVWINGQRAGDHEGGHTPFRLDITGLVKPGPNTVTLRAEDPPSDRFIPRGKQYWEPKSRGIFYTRTSGIWQPVWLEAAGESYLEKARILTTLNGSVQAEAAITRPQPDLKLAATVKFKGEEVATGVSAARGSRALLGLQITDPQLWNVNQPNLYDITFELRKGNTVLDRVQSYFGVRTVTVESGRMLINGRPTYLKMLLDQGYWPQSTLTPPTDDAIQFDIKAAMDMGFNGVRKHQKVEDPRFLYWADKMGFLVSGEMANAYQFDAGYVDRFTREWIAAVERDFNHPSIVLWIPINESWGVPNLRDPLQQNHLRANYMLTKSLDPTRPVIENDGWEHVDAYDLFGIHDYAKDGELLFRKYSGRMAAGKLFPPNGRAALAPGYLYNGAPVFLSEFGGIAYIPPSVTVPSDSWGYSGVEKSPEAAVARLRSLYEAIARLPEIMGVCYTQITDVEQEVNGLLTYDRKLKFDPKAIRELNDMLR